MALIKVKPTSPGRRSLVKVVKADLHKGEPFAPLLLPQFQKSGRNNNGRITMRHKGGGHKHHYRIVDFKRDKDGIAAKVERLEYDPNRSANLALLLYVDGERRYIIAPKGVGADTSLVSGAEAPIKPGNSLPLRNIPVARRFIASKCFPEKERRSRARQARACNCLRVKAAMRNCACARERSARCMLTAAPRLARSATRSTTCAPSERRAPHAGAASVRRCAAWR